MPNRADSSTYKPGYLSALLITLPILMLGAPPVTADGSRIDEQHSIARVWNEVLLEAIRADYARPTVHARNLFHVSVVMYDAWAAYDDVAKPYLLGNTIDGF